jgi:hypothetical protein
MAVPLPADLGRVDPADAWRPWVPDDCQPFDPKWAGHLFRRAAFGASPDEIGVAVRDGPAKTLDRLFAGDARADRRAAFLADAGEQLARDDDPAAVRGWWVYAVLHSGHPLREKLTLFWHNHFATSIAKVRSPLLMFRQNRTLREHALGRFGRLLAAVARDPAMLVWLDSNENVKSHPNENFAREVMELFTLGVGNYTEKDIREAARAFTGWHVNGSGDAFERNADEHDSGPKTVFGQSGPWDGDDVQRMLLERPACARFLAGKLYRFLVSETAPPSGLLDPLAEQLRKSDYDVGALVQTVLRSRLFFSHHAYRKRIKSPVEYVLGAVQAAWMGPYPPGKLADALEPMGQALFAPPNVKGWAGGAGWLTDATILARHNFAERFCPAPPQPPPVPMVPALLPVPMVPGLPALPVVPKVPGSGDGEPEQPCGDDPAPATGERQPDQPPLAPGIDAAWYVRRVKAMSPADIVRAIGEQFFPGGLPDRVAPRLEAFLGQEPVPDARVREAIHAVLCLPEYQLC